MNVTKASNPNVLYRWYAKIDEYYSLNFRDDNLSTRDRFH